MFSIVSVPQIYQPLQGTAYGTAVEVEFGIGPIVPYHIVQAVHIGLVHFLIVDGEPEYTYTFQMSDTATINAAEGSTASVGKSVAYQGVPYYMAQMNEWIRTFSQKFNDILTSGYAGDQKGVALFTANMMTENKQYFFGNHGDETEDEYVERAEKILAELGSFSTVFDTSKYLAVIR
mgnify:CR=1 FL=1